MSKRVFIDEPEKLSKYLQGNVSEASKLTEVPERTICQWISGILKVKEHWTTKEVRHLLLDCRRQKDAEEVFLSFWFLF